MATFYVGPRSVLKGRNANDSAHPYKGVGKYSNWSVHNTSHVLDGAPDSDHVPGEGRHPHDLAMSRWYRGLRDLWPLDDAGSNTRIDGARFRPLEFKGISGIFAGSWGHGDRETPYSVYNNYVFDGVGTNVLDDPGHAIRGIDAVGTANSFGRFAPYIYKGGASETLSDAGQTLPAGYDNSYGHNRVNEWRGVPASEALNV